MTNLPQPEAEALAQSRQLLDLIRAEIKTAGGWISFARYMEMALYTPHWGYYTSSSKKFGASGDFVTAPEMTPLFGQTLANQLYPLMQESAPCLVEAGAGSGLLAVDVLQALEQMNALPQDYFIMEISPGLRQTQAGTLAEKVPHLLSRVRWLDALPDGFRGVVFANELLDAIPVRLLVSRHDGLFERGVGLNEHHELQFADVPADRELAGYAAQLTLPASDTMDYVTEFHPGAARWVTTQAERLQQGAILLIDYGYPRAEYYLPNRAQGTIQCYYRHHVHNDLLLWPGLNDITSFIDFTAIAEAGYDAGMDVLGYTSHAHFLLNCGLLDALEKRNAPESADYIRAAQAVKRLTSLNDTGELFKVLLLGKNITNLPALGFSRGDRLFSL